MPTPQPPEVLLTATVNALKTAGDFGGDVYAKVAPDSAVKATKRWVVCSITSERDSGYRADRQGSEIFMAVRVVSDDSARCEDGAAIVMDLLHETGRNDRRDKVLDDHPDWYYLNIVRYRAQRVTPLRALGLRFYECGYEFRAVMEAKHGYV